MAKRFGDARASSHGNVHGDITSQINGEKESSSKSGRIPDADQHYPGEGDRR